jgi:hypothetical protein
MYELTTTLPALKTLAEWLLKLTSAKAGERKYLFEALVKPLHAAFQEVHADYGAVLKGLIRALPVGGPGIGWLVAGSATELDDAQAKAAVDAAKRRFDKAREAREPVRDWLRTHAREILLAARREDERRYLYSILVYFLEDHHRPGLDERGFALAIEPILRKGGISMLRTPSSRLAAKIAKLDDPEAIREQAQEALGALGQRAGDVVRTYIALVKALA